MSPAPLWPPPGTLWVSPGGRLAWRNTVFGYSCVGILDLNQSAQQTLTAAWNNAARAEKHSAQNCKSFQREGGKRREKGTEGELPCKQCTNLLCCWAIKLEKIALGSILLFYNCCIVLHWTNSLVVLGINLMDFIKLLCLIKLQLRAHRYSWSIDIRKSSIYMYEWALLKFPVKV